MALTLIPISATAATYSLPAAERLALERSLGVQSALSRYGASAASVTEARGLYDPKFTLETAVGETRDAVNSVSASVPSASRYGRADLSLLQKLPSGADVSLDFNNRRSDETSSTGSSASFLFDPNWRSELKLSLTQPLLQGFGRLATEESILLATAGRDGSAAALYQQAAETLKSVRNLYAGIRRSREIIVQRESSVALATRLVEENRARVAAGLLPPLDLLEAEVGLKLRERDLLDARQGERDLIDQLAEILRFDGPFDVDLPAFELDPPTLDERADLADAFANRPDLQQAAADLEARRVESAAARQRQLPRLDLVGSYGQKGFDEDFPAALEETGRDELRNWEVGVNFAYPLGNRKARGEALRKRYQEQASADELGRLREVARREIRTIGRQLQVDQLRIAVTIQAVELAAEKLKNLEKRRDVGLATTKDVLEGEAQLAQAKTDLADAQATWEAAVTGYLAATGRLLARLGVTLDAERLTLRNSIPGP